MKKIGKKMIVEEGNKEKIEIVNEMICSENKVCVKIERLRGNVDRLVRVGESNGEGIEIKDVVDRIEIKELSK